MQPSCIVTFDDDRWRSFSTRRVLRRKACVVGHIILASKWIDVMKWIGTDSGDVLLVRADSMTRIAPSLIEDLRWHEATHRQRRHPVLLLAEESQPDEALPVDGIVRTAWNADLLAAELMYWLAHSKSVIWLPHCTGHSRW